MARTRSFSSLTPQDGSPNAAPHILIAGLGNAPFPDTRHSVGQRIVSSLSTRLRIPLTSKRHGHIGTSSLSGIPGLQGATVTLFKSKHLMNVSGASVVDALRTNNIHPSHLILLYDSLSHAPMTLSVRLGGSAQGHNGVKSVMHKLGSSQSAKEFWQFRVGVGRGPEVPGMSAKQRKEAGKGVDAAEWVLGRMSREELGFWGPEGAGVDLVLREVERVVRRLSGDEEAPTVVTPKAKKQKEKEPVVVVKELDAKNEEVGQSAVEDEEVAEKAMVDASSAG